MEIRLPLVLDGSTGTQLQKRGFTGDMAAEQWSILHPEAVEDFQNLYIEAGSNVVYSPTFGANAPTLEGHKVFGKVREFNLKLVAISKKVAEGRAYVGGDISPSGKYLYPLGDATFEDLYEIYREQAAALEEAGVDLFAIETMVSLADARAALLAVRSVSKKPVFMTFTCDESGRTMMGTDVVAALVVAQGMGVDAFGLNCSSGPEMMTAQLRRLAEYAQVPLIAKPNAGLPVVVDGKTVYNCSNEEFTAYVDEMASLGVAMFGGCCGSNEEHIRALAEKVKTVKVKKPAPTKTGVLTCATGKNMFALPLDVKIGEALSPTAHLEETLEEAAESDAPVICLSVETEDDVQYLADCEYAVSKPLCLRSGNAEILEKALRVFQGRALYDGNLPESVLQSLAEKYGLIY